MSRMCLGALIVGLVWAGISGPAYAQDTLTILGSGSGAFEAPPVATAGVGTANCTLDRVAVTIACTARVHNIVDLRAGHLHVGGPGVAGPVVIGIPGLPLRASDDFTVSWTWTSGDLTLRAAQGVLKMADVFEACSSGNCYLNFHTTANPGGEVRINLCPQQAELGRAANPFFSINVCVADR
ncbi:MAG: CHRD domain-containing protein [Acidobacteria bacterium]|nr:CHRD domain-containing protein [Acidobacteriota bacterium]